MSRYRGVEHFCRYRTPVALMLDKVFGRAPESYEPAWFESKFTVLPQDSAGSTILTPAPSAKIMYVAEDGDDAIAGAGDLGVYSPADFSVGDFLQPGTVVAFRTPEAAYAKTTSGGADVILFKRGDSFTVTEEIKSKGGISLSERAIFAAYGTGARPILNRTFNMGAFFSHGVTYPGSYTIIKDLNLTWNARDPLHPDFVGWENLTFGGAGVSISKTFTSVTGVLIEGCKVEHSEFGVSASGLDNPNTINELVIRRNNIANIYKRGGPNPPHAQGIIFGAFYVSGLVEENVFYKCGYYLAEGTTAPPSEFEHSVYAVSPEYCVLRNNVSFSPASIHFKSTADVERSLVTALTGLETQIEVNSFFPGTPESGLIAVKIGAGSSQFVLVEYTSRTDTIAQIVETDFTSTPVATGGGKVAVYFPKSKHVSAYGNVFVDGEVGFSFGGNENDIDANVAPRFSHYNIQYNLLARIGHTQPADRKLAFGINPVDNENSIIDNNIIIGPDNTLTNNVYAVNVEGYSNSNIIRRNLSIEGAGSIEPLAIGALDEFYANGVGLSSGSFVDSTVSVEKFALSKGRAESVSGFGDYALTLDMTEDPNASTEIQNYIRNGFSVTAPLITRQPNNLSLSDGQSGVISFDAYGNTLPTFKWYNFADDTEITGQTKNEYRITMTEADDGRQVYGVADFGAVQLTSNPATINLVEPRFVPRLAGTTDSINIPVKQSLTTGQGVRFKFRAHSVTGQGNIAAVRSEDSNSGNVSMRFRRSSNFITLRLSPSISVPNLSSVLFDGNVHVVEYIKEAVDEIVSIKIDGAPFFSATPTTYAGPFEFKSFGCEDGSTTSEHEFFDLEFFDAEEVTTLAWAFDSGEATEAAIVGTGTATINLATGGWFELS